MKSLVLIFLLLSCVVVHANDSLYVIKINFLYGSRPVKEYKNSETKLFGGIKGGHVNIEADGKVLDFRPGNNPIFPHNKKPTGGFSINHSLYWDTTTTKWATVIVPISAQQYTELQNLFDSLPVHTPYDYSVFGMRCAAASYDVLSKIGLFKEVSNPKNIAEHFYPKLLRKKILKWAGEKNYTVIRHEGRLTRKWESDKGLL